MNNGGNKRTTSKKTVAIFLLNICMLLDVTYLLDSDALVVLAHSEAQKMLLSGPLLHESPGLRRKQSFPQPSVFSKGDFMSELVATGSIYFRHHVVLDDMENQMEKASFSRVEVPEVLASSENVTALEYVCFKTVMSSN